MHKTASVLFALCTWLSPCAAQVPHKARQLPISNTTRIFHTESSPTAPYDPDACRASWISYVEEDFRNLSNWVRLWGEVNAWSEGPGKNATPTLFEVEHATAHPDKTIPILIPAPTPELCGVKRFMSVGNTPEDHIWTVGERQAIWDVPRPTGLPNWNVNLFAGPIWFFREPSVPKPTCDIHIGECPEQWRLFRDYFANWTTTLDRVNPFAWRGSEGNCEDPGCVNGNLDMIRINFDLYLAWRVSDPTADFHAERMWWEEAPFDTSFLAGCSPILLNNCLLGNGISQVSDLMFRGRTLATSTGAKDPQVINTLLPVTTPGINDRECDVWANQFVLIYFPSKSNVTRNVCAHDGWGEDVSILAPNRTVTRTATLDEIVFQPYNGESKSTMYPSDPNSKWTFYDDKVYLAINTISASGNCYRPGKTITNHILTLDPSDLSTLVTSRSTWEETPTWDFNGVLTSRTYGKAGQWQSARLFNLADLEGPLPLRVAAANYGNEDLPSFIVENDYFPQVVLPRQVTELEPMWASCHPFGDASSTFKTTTGKGVFDPPITLDGTASLAAATIHPYGGHGAHTTTTALPGPGPLSPNSPVRTDTMGSAEFARETAAVRPLSGFGQLDFPSSFNQVSNTPDSGNMPGNFHEQQDVRGSPLSSPANFVPTAVFMMGNTKVTASALADPDSLLFGTQVLRVGGPVIVTAGHTVSFGPDGPLQIGTQNFNLPVPTKVSQSNGQMRVSWVLPSTPMATGAGGRSDVGSSSASIYQIYDNMSELMASGGGTPNIWTDASGSVHSSQATARTAEAKKKSRAGRLADLMPDVILFFGLVTGVSLMCLPF